MARERDLARRHADSQIPLIQNAAALKSLARSGALLMQLYENDRAVVERVLGARLSAESNEPLAAGAQAGDEYVTTLEAALEALAGDEMGSRVTDRVIADLEKGVRRWAREGNFLPFARTKFEREASGDPRPSLEERYGSHEAYLKRVTEVVADLLKARLLLPDDAARYVDEAARNDPFRR